ncbi:MAG: HEAT repeat domain-containing protein [Thermoguttaceae bacterium]|jgi:HEAT repeat protein
MRLLLPILLFLCLGCGPKWEGAYEGKPLRHWEEMAESKTQSDRLAAAEALGELGPNGLVGICGLLRDRDNHVRAMAGLAVTKMGAKAVPRLIELLKAPEASTRAGAAIALRHTGSEEVPTAIAPLTDLLRDDSQEVRGAALASLRFLKVEQGETARSRLKREVSPPSPSAVHDY